MAVKPVFVPAAFKHGTHTYSQESAWQLYLSETLNFRKPQIFAPPQIRSPLLRNPTVRELKLQLLHLASKCFRPIFGSIHTVTKYFSKGTDSPAFQRAVLCSLFELNALANLWDSSRQSRSLKSCCDVRKRYIPWSCVSTWTSKSTASLYWKKRKRIKKIWSKNSQLSSASFCDNSILCCLHLYLYLNLTLY